MIDIDDLTMDERIGQLLCWWIRDESSDDIKRIIEQFYIGSVFTNRLSQQRDAAVKVWLGEIPAQGQSPVTLPGYFERGFEMAVLAQPRYPPLNPG